MYTYVINAHTLPLVHRRSSLLWRTTRPSFCPVGWTRPPLQTIWTCQRRGPSCQLRMRRRYRRLRQPSLAFKGIPGGVRGGAATRVCEVAAVQDSVSLLVVCVRVNRVRVNPQCCIFFPWLLDSIQTHPTAPPPHCLFFTERGGFILPPPPPSPLSYFIHHTILLITISG